MSKAQKKGSEATEIELLQYNGQWKVELPKLELILGDKGLVLQDGAKHHAISAKFDKPIDPSQRPFVVQYEVQLQEGLECGGAYLKLLTNNESFQPDEFENSVPYTIMFGPDKCGGTNKVHFIINKLNPITQTIVEHHAKNVPLAILDKHVNLYTLAIHPNQSYSIYVNQELKVTDSFSTGFNPSIVPPESIPDPEDVKPETWVDNEKIADPAAVKPEDWDEDAPKKIIDENATKPEDWLDDEPKEIPDPKASAPEDWDEEEDGVYVAPKIPNPKCSTVSGCGEWTKPLINNPNYKGLWKAPLIDNPDFIGQWAPRNIPNPEYYEVENPSALSPIGAIGFELWTLQRGILFDNIFIGHSISDAIDFAEETWVVKHGIEAEASKAVKKAMKNAEEENAEEENAEENKSPNAIFVERIIKDFHDFVHTIQTGNIKAAVLGLPHIAAGILLIILLPLFIAGVFVSGPSPSVSKATPKTTLKSKSKSKKESDEEEEEEEAADEEEDEEPKTSSTDANVTKATKRSKASKKN